MSNSRKSKSSGYEQKSKREIETKLQMIMVLLAFIDQQLYSQFVLIYIMKVLNVPNVISFSHESVLSALVK